MQGNASWQGMSVLNSLQTALSIFLYAEALRRGCRRMPNSSLHCMSRIGIQRPYPQGCMCSTSTAAWLMYAGFIKYTTAKCHIPLVLVTLPRSWQARRPLVADCRRDSGGQHIAIWKTGIHDVVQLEDLIPGYSLFLSVLMCLIISNECIELNASTQLAGGGRIG